MGYKNNLPSRKPSAPVAVPVNQVIAGREDDMAPASGGQGMAFKQTPMSQFKRWLVMGSQSSTMYRKASDMSNDNIAVVTDLLKEDYRPVIETIVDFSLKGTTPKQDGLLTVLSMALAYEDMTVRAYNSKGEQVFNLKCPNPVFKIYRNVDMLYVHTHDSKGQFAGNYAFDLNTMKWVDNQETAYYWSDSVDVNGFHYVVYSKEARRAALSAASKMIRQASQLFQLVDLTDHQRGWGRIFHKLVEDFYNESDARELAYQIIKYGQRNGWTHADALRKTKIKPANQVVSNLYGWTTGKWNTAEVTPSQARDKRGFISDALTVVWAADAARAAQTEKEVVKLIRDYDLPREAIERANTAWLKSPKVWEALLEKMPANALVRNLRTMAEVGLLKPTSDSERLVVSKLLNKDLMKSARVHPMKFIQAAAMYAPEFLHISGVSNSYNVSQAILDALQDALESSFEAVEPTGKIMMISLDVSGSMSWNQLESAKPLYPYQASAIMGLEIAKSETFYMVNAFSGHLVDLKFSKRMGIGGAIEAVSHQSAGSTNIGLPIEKALNENLKIDGFVIITDNDLNQGYHPTTLLNKYRNKINPDARLVVLGMQSNGITVCDPNDAGQLDYMGFNTDTPKVVKDFVAGRF